MGTSRAPWVILWLVGWLALLVAGYALLEMSAVASRVELAEALLAAQADRLSEARGERTAPVAGDSAALEAAIAALSERLAVLEASSRGTGAGDHAAAGESPAQPSPADAAPPDRAVRDAPTHNGAVGTVSRFHVPALPNRLPESSDTVEARARRAAAWVAALCDELAVDEVTCARMGRAIEAFRRVREDLRGDLSERLLTPAEFRDELDTLHDELTDTLRRSLSDAQLRTVVSRMSLTTAEGFNHY